MNLTQKKISKLTFPQKIKFEEVSIYLQKFEKMDHNSTIIFDMSKTSNIHSSFIGFLIHAKSCVNRNNNIIILVLSHTVKKIFLMLDILDYFLPEIETIVAKKPA